MDDDLVRVAGYPSIEAANAVVRELIVHGIGATVGVSEIPTSPPVLESGPAGAPGPDGIGGAIVPTNPPEEPYTVLVVATDRSRAREILGLTDDRERELAGVDRARSSAPPLKILIPVLLVAFIVIPVAAFYISFKASGG